MKEFWMNESIRIDHPLADRISVQDSPLHYAGENTSEIAFFYKGKFVTTPIKPFEEYAGAEEGDSRVYAWVPNSLIQTFLEEHKV